MTMPKLHTSLAEVNFLYAIASGAVQRIGILPPYVRKKMLKNSKKQIFKTW